MRYLRRFVLLFGFFSSFSLYSREPYHVEVTVDTVSETVTAPNLVDLRRDLSTSGLEKLIPIYTPTSAVSFDFNIRGLLANASFAANSTTLVVEIPNADVSTSFTGSTREESLTLFKDFIHDGGNHHGLLKRYARYSPIDPIAGNPNSLMSKMAEADYLLGRLYPLSGCDWCNYAQPKRHLFRLGTDYGRGFTKEFETSIVDFPLRYSYSPCRTWAFILDALLTYYRNGGASSLTGSLGAGLRYPVTQRWSLTPVLRFGNGGSVDLCTSGAFFSAGVTSEYDYKFWNKLLSITNYAAYITSTNLWLGGINCNYNLHNYIFKNGVSLTTCSWQNFCGRPLNLSVSFVDTYFAREHLYIHHYDEVGIFLIANCINPCLKYDSLSLGFTYQFGEKDYKGYYVKAAYYF